MSLRQIKLLFLSFLQNSQFVLALYFFVLLEFSLLSNLLAQTFILVSINFLYAKRGAKFHNDTLFKIVGVLLNDEIRRQFFTLILQYLYLFIQNLSGFMLRYIILLGVFNFLQNWYTELFVRMLGLFVIQITYAFFTTVLN